MYSPSWISKWRGRLNITNGYKGPFSSFICHGLPRPPLYISRHNWCLPVSYVTCNHVPSFADASRESALDRAVTHYRGMAFARSTQRAYSSHLKSYLEFCALYGYNPLPADNTQLCRYAAYLASRLCYNSITKYLNIIRLLHLESGLQNPLENNYFVGTVLRGIKRDKGSAVHRKLPMTPDILLKIRSALCLAQPKDLLFWVTCLVSFFGLLRKSSLLPTSVHTFNPNYHPCLSDLAKSPNGLALRIKGSKTVQFQERQYLIPLPFLPAHPLCVCTALLALRHQQPRHWPTSAPLLALPSGHLLTQPAFTAQLRDVLHSCGLPAHAYSAHSFRRGAASYMFEVGLPGELIQVLGDWKSQCYRIYLEIKLDTKFRLLSPLIHNLPRQ